MPDLVRVGSRLAEYDRHAAHVGFGTDGFDVPVGTTVLNDYVVPAGKIFRCDLLGILYKRVTAAAPAGSADRWVSVTPNGGAAYTLLSTEEVENTVGASDHVYLTDVGYFQAGDEIIIKKQITGTGGSTFRHYVRKGVEFDV